LRKSKIDIGFYDQDYKLHVLENFVIGDGGELNTVDAEKISSAVHGPVKAVILNHGDHVYAKVRFDNQTILNLQKDGFSKISDDLSRSLIWKSLWHQMLDRELSSSKYFNMVVEHLPHETNEDTIVFFLEKSRLLTELYLPLNKGNSSKELLFNTLL